ncbi:UDP-glucose--1,2-diacylglycerol glucosyltransferase, putative [Syntrophotalea carbinolica DSM 2380]|uniref:UDP-glucose--1,2-diacylglycerol glucosyltransferase, putative n=1 Tax=Syntrophotalea carbinolica (strain DSM 2380 / NBRC 103641 / GraBd1) TaxID=338963 RepID=Q3A0L2_SYNC1|nr:glycosyltransferase [Syntrophotalea carbinolica]ABA90095.1 UDP-glucose--1,2-diacylglycerol glucosyltransferase, putative [Syntrophotalea carbinolica DSM 2380]
MNILMVTNTFTPHVGGVARSVQSYCDAFRQRGHRVLVIAPHFDGVPAHEPDVLRFPAIEHFHHSDFSVPLPAPVGLHRTLDEFAPDIVHSHHPFLLGHTALRTAAQRQLPMLFTHHTMYERYTHYLPIDSERVRRFAIELAVGYCNLCDAVVAPSTTLADCLRRRGVQRPIEVIPTGIDPQPYEGADGAAFREKIGVPAETFLVGYLGRLSPEKNLGFLARSVAAFMQQHSQVRFLMVGEGPARQEVQDIFREKQLTERLHLVGLLDRAVLAAAYRAMDTFVFASQSETQGMVLAEAMTAGTPVIAVSAPGVRDIVRDGYNGYLLAKEDSELFVAALNGMLALSRADRQRLQDGALDTARDFSMSRSADRMLALYAHLIVGHGKISPHHKRWTAARNRMEEEWKILHNITHALAEALRTETGLQPRETSE